MIFIPASIDLLLTDEKTRTMRTTSDGQTFERGSGGEIIRVHCQTTSGTRLKYEVGRRYAISRQRGRKAIAHLVLDAIDLQAPADITAAEVHEAYNRYMREYMRDRYHPKKEKP